MNQQYFRTVHVVVFEVNSVGGYRGARVERGWAELCENVSA